MPLLLSETAAKQISDLVNTTDTDRLAPESGSHHATHDAYIVNVTSATATDTYFYPAQVDLYRAGTFTLQARECYARDVNSGALTTGRYLARRGGFHTNGKPVFLVDAGADAVRFVKCVNGTPTSGRYDAVLMDENADGTLTASATSVWLRDSNDTPALIQNEIYLAKRTGNTSGRDVYTWSDFNLTITDLDGSPSLARTFKVKLHPDNTWLIEADGARTAKIKRILRVEEEGGSPGVDDVKKIILSPNNNWTVSGSAGDATVVRELDIKESGAIRSSQTYIIDFEDQDFDVSGGSGIANVATNGFTGTRNLYYPCCSSGELVVRSTTITFLRGLCKSFPDYPSCP